VASVSPEFSPIISYSRIPHPYRATFLDQLADYLIQLGSLSFSAIGCLRYDRAAGLTNIVPCPGRQSIYKSSLEYIRHEQNQLLLTDETFPSTSGERELACTILSRAATTGIRTEFTAGPFPLSYPDLHYNNILVNDRYDITGIIDCSGATTVPQEIFASVPGFRCPPGRAEDSEIYAESLKMFIQPLRQRESILVDRGNWIVISDFQGVTSPNA